MPEGAAGPAGTVAFIFSRYPKISETFILHDLCGLEERGIGVHIFPFFLETIPTRHDAVCRLADRVDHQPAFSGASGAALMYWLLRRPLCTGYVILESLAAHLTTPGFFIRTPVILLKAFYIARRVHKSGVRHLHAHYATWPALVARIVSRLTGLSYSLTVHAHDLYCKNPMIGKKIRGARAVVTISGFNRALLIRHGGVEAARKIEVIRCGVDVDAFSPEGRTVSSNPPLILCVASLEEYKGYPWLLEACHLLKERGYRFRCFSVGKGELFGSLSRRIAALGLTREVRLLGPQPQRWVSRFMRRASLFMLPSIIARNGKMEGIPVALMEAMACELPVVATRISGIPELVHHQENGILVPQKDGVALADAASSLLDWPERARELGRQGRKTVLSDYNLEKNLDRKAWLIARLAGISCKVKAHGEERTHESHQAWYADAAWA